MNKKISSKHAVVARRPYEIYMAFTDMRNFVNFLPESKREGMTADFDTISGAFHGISLGIRVVSRSPYSQIDFESTESPVNFSFRLHFDEAEGGASTDFYIDLDAELNAMMNLMIGGKLRDALDKIVDAMADAAQGKFPEGFNPSEYGNGGF